MKTVKFDLEDRLIDYGVQISDIVEMLPTTLAGNYLGKQLIRSGLAPALLYGEAQAAESRKDFIHKMKVGLKELRESNINLKLISRKGYLESEPVQKEAILKETDELVSIFVASIATAKKNLQREKNS